MSIYQYAAAAAAAIVAVWPQLRRIPDVLAPSVGPDYQTAILNLASVRLRLRATDCLGEDQKKAIDVLTLALVDGSDE
jgi:hypothetical protein